MIKKKLEDYLYDYLKGILIKIDFLSEENSLQTLTYLSKVKTKLKDTNEIDNLNKIVDAIIKYFIKNNEKHTALAYAKDHFPENVNKIKSFYSKKKTQNIHTTPLNNNF